MYYKKKFGHRIFGQKDFPVNYQNLSENIVCYTLNVIWKKTKGISKLYFKSFMLQLKIFNTQLIVFTR